MQFVVQHLYIVNAIYYIYNINCLGVCLLCFQNYLTFFEAFSKFLYLFMLSFAKFDLNADVFAYSIIKSGAYLYNWDIIGYYCPVHSL